MTSKFLRNFCHASREINEEMCEKRWPQLFVWRHEVRTDFLSYIIGYFHFRANFLAQPIIFGDFMNQKAQLNRIKLLLKLMPVSYFFKKKCTRGTPCTHLHRKIKYIRHCLSVSTIKQCHSTSPRHLLYRIFDHDAT